MFVQGKCPIWIQNTFLFASVLIGETRDLPKLTAIQFNDNLLLCDSIGPFCLHFAFYFLYRNKLPNNLRSAFEQHVFLYLVLQQQRFPLYFSGLDFADRDFPYLQKKQKET